MATSSSAKENMSFVTSNKGQRLLVLDEHVYRCNKKTAGKKYWMCMISGCSVTVHTTEDDVYLRGGTSDHEHESSADFIKTTRLRHQMKQRGLNELTPVNVIYEEEIMKASLDTSALAAFPTNQEKYPTMAKARRKVLPPLPQSCIFTIPDKYTVTTSGERFLLIDESPVRRERLLIFASDLQLDLLFRSETIYMDGTFSKAPPHFLQVYIIHAVNYDICLPCVFVLMLDKKGKTYRRIFFELRQMAHERQKQFSPTLIVTDFESGVLPVVKAEFPAAKNYGCYFHFNQAVFKKIQHLGLQTEYSRNEQFRGVCKKLMALAMMPVDTVSASFNEICNEARDLPSLSVEPLMTYFEKQWMSDPDLWNVFLCDNRTNNFCEGYHNRMNHRIHRNHPSIWRFIEFMQKEESRFETVVAQWSTGAAKKKSVRATAKQNRINTLHERYRNGLIDAPTLLNGLSHHVGSTRKKH